MYDDHERKQIDPENRYPSDGLRLVERNALAIINAMRVPYSLDRARDVIELDSEHLTIVVTAEALELRTPTVEWTMGSYGPAVSSRLRRRVRWKRGWSAGDDEELRALIAEAIEARRAEFQTCSYCGERTPPEQSIESTYGKGRICHSCASEYEQVVF